MSFQNTGWTLCPLSYGRLVVNKAIYQVLLHKKVACMLRHGSCGKTKNHESKVASQIKSPEKLMKIQATQSEA